MYRKHLCEQCVHQNFVQAIDLIGNGQKPKEADAPMSTLRDNVYKILFWVSFNRLRDAQTIKHFFTNHGCVVI